MGAFLQGTGCQRVLGYAALKHPFAGLGFVVMDLLQAITSLEGAGMCLTAAWGFEVRAWPCCACALSASGYARAHMATRNPIQTWNLRGVFMACHPGGNFDTQPNDYICFFVILQEKIAILDAVN